MNRRHTGALEAALTELERQHQHRERRTVQCFDDRDSAAAVIVDGRRLVNFYSNDYLGLARDPRIAAALAAAATRWGTGTGASHLVTGHGLEHARLEEELAAFVGRESALTFSTGYMANLAVLTTLAGPGDLVLLDRLSHASLIDAALLSRARLRRYPHADAHAATRMLADASHEDRAAILATDGVFSMDGDLAPLPGLAAAASARGAWLVVDDAHGLGVIGASGRGTLEHYGLDAEAVPVLVGTFGKAFGTCGAFVAGAKALIETLVQSARTYIFTTAPPQALAAATRTAMALAALETWRRERVLALTRRFRMAAGAAGIPLTSSVTPIQPIVIGSSEAAVLASSRLYEAGFWVTAIRPPTVPRNAARLRVTLSAAHTESEVDGLVEALRHSLPVEA